MQSAGPWGLKLKSRTRQTTTLTSEVRLDKGHGVKTPAGHAGSTTQVKLSCCKACEVCRRRLLGRGCFRHGAKAP